MIIYFIIYLLLILFSIRFVNNNKEYLDKKQTTCINGIFIILVFFSHFYSYYQNNLDGIINKIPWMIISKFGQLVVTPFLFFSGYGIYYSIKNKENYIKKFTINRFLITWLNFAIAIVLYAILDLIIDNKFSITELILAFTGYTSIGNSNWYMFAMFCLYIFTIIAFNKKINDKIGDKGSIILLFCLTFVYIFLVDILRDTWYVDTILCFPYGMLYGFYKKNIDKYVMNDKIHYILSLITLLALFVILYILPYNVIKYNILSIVFVTLIALALIKIKIQSKVLEFFGKNLFWIYILQRIPMILITKYTNINIILSFGICLSATLILTIAFSKISKIYISKILKKQPTKLLKNNQ